MSSGHSWNDDRCELCGDKDWYADKYCSGNPNVAEQRLEWIKLIKQETLYEAVMAHKNQTE